ncbi:MAG: OmpA family protein, partial [Muribaculaceae bacterium]|nr:OmpA family protein [Muribaculaceae bacterium]
MRTLKTTVVALLAGCMLFTGCQMTKTGKGALIGGGGGAALGAGIGALIGGGKGAGIGSAIGAAIGAGAGTLIGRKIDKQEAELKKQLAEYAHVEQGTDANGLQAIKVTFASGILFPTNGTTISANASRELSEFAQSLIQQTGTDGQSYGFNDK